MAHRERLQVGAFGISFSTFVSSVSIDESHNPPNDGKPLGDESKACLRTDRRNVDAKGP